MPSLWTNHPFSPAGRAEVQKRLKTLGPHFTLHTPAIVPENNLSAGDPDPMARRVDILWGQPAVRDVRAGSARWIALTSAGYTRYDTPPVRAALEAREAVLTNASSVYDEPCAQHVLAQMLAASRRLPACFADQSSRQWKPVQRREESFLLRGQTVMLLGYGTIARRLAAMLAPFGMKLIGVRRRPTGSEAVTCVTPDRVDELITASDHVVNILPANESTTRFMNTERISRLKPGAIYYNIGRGATTDQDALRAALVAGKLQAAYLDVFDPEPLAPDDPLWQTPNCVITPHSAGGSDGEEASLIAHFFAGFESFLANRPLADRVF